MATAKKVTKSNHLPSVGDDRFIVYSKQFNDLIDVVNELEPADGTLIVDIISESTADAGVTIDGTLIKDDSISVSIINEGSPNDGVTADGVLFKDGAITPDNGVVTQITSISTGVTLDKPSGVITTVTATTAALSASTFAVTNIFATNTSNIVASIVDYSGTIITNGVPSVIIDNRGAGSFNIIIYNAHATNALNGTLAIAFTILK